MASIEDLTNDPGALRIYIPKQTDIDSPLPPLPDRDTITRGMVFTPEKIDLIARDISDCRINATFITRNLNDQGRIIKCIAEIQDALATRQDDLLFYLERISAAPNIYSGINASPRKNSPNTAVYLSPTTSDPSPNAISHCLFELQRSASVLNDKLKQYRIKPALIFNLPRRKNTLLGLTAALHDAWINLLIQLTLSISRASSEAATFANGNINKLAIAAGAEDWNGILGKIHVLELSVQDAQSYFIQGEKYFLGFGVAKSYDLAFKRYHTAAKLGLPQAAVMLGTMFENGYGQVKDPINALKWYKVAASSCDMEALNHLGRIYENGIGCKIDIALAYKYYKQAAEVGHLDGMTSFGRFLQTGRGCEVDCKCAYTQFKIAAEKDYAKAQNYLGTCYYLGKGVSLDPHKAVHWFKKSSEQGFAPAFNNLGICYEEGTGVTKDLLSAQMNYSIAADLHHPGGMNNLGYLYLLEDRFDEALKCFNMAYSLGNVDALYNLGTLYETGRPEPLGKTRKPEIETAILYYKDAASKGCIKSQLRLGAIFSEESEIRDIKTAKEYLSMAASENKDINAIKIQSSLTVSDPDSKFQIESQNLLGECFEISSFSDSDLEEAAKWYLEASKSGHPRATFNLGHLYETGRGVKKDFKKAVHLYQEAIIRGSTDAEFRIQELQELDLI